MREEVLRLDKVTYIDQGVKELTHFSLNIFAGEIMGLVPVNGIGLAPLLRLLRQNLPIHYGYVYYRERLVNRWEHSDLGNNRIGLISGQSGLADDLTVADNVFVLRHGFTMRTIRRGVLRRQLEPFLKDTGVSISADAYAWELAAFERVVVELIKAVVAGDKLVILTDAGTVISDTQLRTLHGILRHYTAQGISFLYVSQHYEEIRQVCDRAALMMNGQITKILPARETKPEVIRCLDVEHYERLVLSQRGARPRPQAVEPALEVRGLWHGTVAGLDLSVAPGECVVLQDLDNHIIGDLTDVMTLAAAPRRGSIRVCGKGFGTANRRDVAVIQRLATSTMLFPELSYLDNLCFTMDHRTQRLWLRKRPKESIRREYAPWLGEDVFDKHIEDLSQLQKYDLIYARILLQRPKAVFCIQPFMQADVEQRMHIWKLLEMLLEKNIAVVILAVNLADTLSLADRLVQVQAGRVLAAYDRGEFGALPDSAPWRYLWKSWEPAKEGDA